METFSALLALCAGHSPVTGEFPSQRPVMRSFDVFFDLHLNKRLSKQSKRRWFEMPSRSLWRHCNEYSPPVADALSVTFWLNHWIKADVKPNYMVRPIFTFYCLHACGLPEIGVALNIINTTIHLTDWQHTCASSAKWGMITFVGCSESLSTSSNVLFSQTGVR